MRLCLRVPLASDVVGLGLRTGMSGGLHEDRSHAGAKVVDNKENLQDDDFVTAPAKGGKVRLHSFRVRWIVLSEDTRS